MAKTDKFIDDGSGISESLGLVNGKNEMILEPSCYKRKCRFFIGVEGDEPDEVLTCEVYPKGIPEGIAYEGEKCPEFEKE